MWSEKFEQALEEMEKTGKEFAFAKSVSWHSQEVTSAIKSSIMVQHMKDGTSAQKAEALARSSEGYLQHLLETKDAIHKELLAKTMYEKAFAKYESLRSLVSLDKKTSGYSSLG